MRQVFFSLMLTSTLLVPAQAHDHPVGDPGATINVHGDITYNPVHNSDFFTIKTGAWNDPTVWSRGVPTATDKVIIKAGHTVTILNTSAVAEAIGIYPGGKLKFDPDENTQLTVTDVLVAEGGVLEIGTPVQPVDAEHKATVIFRDTPMNFAQDPKQYWHGILCFGTLVMVGAEKSSGGGVGTLSVEPRAGQTTLTLKDAVSGWRVGDRVAIPDTRTFTWNVLADHDPYQPAERTIVGIQGNVITLNAPLALDHFGSAPAKDGSIFYPQIMNLSRNVVLKSANPNGVRAHTMCTHGATVDMRYVQFDDMGRTRAEDLNNTVLDSNGQATHIGTNQIGRYSIHMHHLSGPENPTNTGYQYQLIGNAVNNETKWGITIHGTGFGLIKNNNVFASRGSGIVTEDGNEVGNVFDGNYVLYSPGRNAPFANAPASDTHARLTHEDHDATWGSGYWFAGGNQNFYRNNVAANARMSGFNLYGYNLKPNLRMPLFRGADLSDPAESALMLQITLDGVAQSVDVGNIQEFDRNLTFCSYQGFQFLANRGNNYVVTNLITWNPALYGFESKGKSDIFRVKGYTARGGHTMNTTGAAVFAGDGYSETELDGFDIQGFWVGLSQRMGHFGIYKNGFFANRRNVAITYTGPYGDAPTIHTFKNVTFQSYGSFPLSNIDTDMNFNTTNLLGHFEIYLDDLNGDPNEDYRVYFKEQAPNEPLPVMVLNPTDPSTDLEHPTVFPPTRVGCPAPNLTNQQCMDRFGTVSFHSTAANRVVTYTTALAGSIAPCLDGNCSTAVRLPGFDDMLLFRNTQPKIFIEPRYLRAGVSNIPVEINYKPVQMPVGGKAKLAIVTSLPTEAQLNSIPNTVVDADLDGYAQVISPAFSNTVQFVDGYVIAWPVDANNQKIGTGFEQVPLRIYRTLGPAVTAPLVAFSQNVSTYKDTEKSIVLTGIDPNPNSLSWNFRIQTQPQHGTLTQLDNVVVYRPTVGYTGPDSFQFSSYNERFTSVPADVNISVLSDDEIPASTTRLIVTHPTEGLVMRSTILDVSYSILGDLTDIDHAHWSLDDGAEVADRGLNGAYRFSNLAPGAHVLRGYLGYSNHARVPGTEKSIHFTVDNDISESVSPTERERLLINRKTKVVATFYGNQADIFDRDGGFLTTLLGTNGVITFDGMVNGRSLASGTYIVELEEMSGDKRVTKMVILK